VSSLANIINNMKTISVSVSKSVYEDFRRGAREKDRSIAQLIREAMKLYRDLHLSKKEPLRNIETFPECKLVGKLPTREELWDEMTEERIGRR